MFELFERDVLVFEVFERCLVFDLFERSFSV